MKIHITGLIAACVISLAACTDDPDATEPGGGGGEGGDAGAGGGGGGSGGGGGGCVADIPDSMPSWLSDYQSELVARLTGATELTPGTTLADRATETRRAQTRDFLFAELQALGYEAQLHEYGTGANVWAQLDATEPTDELLILGAHYDSMPDCPGANDNATGVAATYAVARYLRDVECRSVSVIFALFDEEELGQVGSEEFAAMLTTTTHHLVSVHTIDQMGWDSDGDFAIELERPDPGLFEQYEASVQAGGFSIPLIETTTGWTDHVAFRLHGFEAVGVTEGYASGDTTPHYHLPSDTHDTVNFDYLASTTALLNYHFARLLMPAVTAP